MATDAGVKTIDECNAERISVFFDACVLISAIRRNDSPQREHLLKVDRGLRLIASVTLYEVAFASRGMALATLQSNEKWIRDRHFTHIRFDRGVGERFERLLRREDHSLRGKTTLGDFLLACWARSLSPAGRVAIATENERDFRRFSVPLVAEFLPSASAPAPPAQRLELG